MKMQEQTIGTFNEAYVGVQVASSTKVKNINKTGFLNYIQTYRALAAICVVAVHCTALLTDSGKSIEGIVFQRSTHMFVVIAGFMFQHLAYKFKWKEYYTSKLKFVILPYVILNLPIIAYRIFIGKSLLAKGLLPGIGAIIYSLLVGNHLITLWFIPMISLFYIVAPLLVVLDKDKRLYYFLPFFIIISFCVTRTNDATVNPVLMFIHFFSVYVTGMFLSRYKEQVFELTGDYLYHLLLIVIGLLVFQYFFPYYYEQMQYVQKSAWSLLLLYVFRKYDKYVPAQIGLLADMSFGIYLVHGLVLFVLSYLFNFIVSGGHLEYSVLNYFLVFLLILTISITYIRVVKLVAKKHSRKLIGC